MIEDPERAVAEFVPPFPMGSVPATSAVKETALNEGFPAAFP
jgi:hypothetical protein